METWQTWQFSEKEKNTVQNLLWTTELNVKFGVDVFKDMVTQSISPNTKHWRWQWQLMVKNKSKITEKELRKQHETYETECCISSLWHPVVTLRLRLWTLKASVLLHAGVECTVPTLYPRAGMAGGITLLCWGFRFLKSQSRKARNVVLHILS